MDKCEKTAALYIATLKAIALIHQHDHWVAKGIDFYGKHQLFERIYKSALEDLDLAAEKFIGLFSAGYLEYNLQSELLHKVLNKYSEQEGLSRSLAIEKDFLKFSVAAYNCFEAEGKLKESLGLDDMLMGIASHREEAVYLLQQALLK